VPGIVGAVCRSVVFDDVRVPVENRIGEEGEGMRLARTWITTGRLDQASRCLGITRRCVELAAAYAQQRVTFGQKLCERRGLQFAIADPFMEHRLGQTFVHRAAWKADRGER
jgi:acyl-CoA dehydrogenase